MATTEVDFVELHDDVSGSPLWNHDLAPTPLSRRTWSTYNIAIRRCSTISTPTPGS